MPTPGLSMPMRIPADLLVELGAYTGEFWSSWQQEPHICAAIRAYINPAPAACQSQDAPSDSGHQWKQLFLPSGTRLRASYRHQDYFATVEGSDIRCDGRSLSPSGFANLRGSGNRNAWKAVWLRFPGSPQWLLADACRALQQAAAVRQFAADATGVAPAQQQALRPAAYPAGSAAAAAPPRAGATLPLRATPAAPGQKKSRRGRRRKQRKHGAALKTPC